MVKITENKFDIVTPCDFAIATEYGPVPGSNTK